MKFNADTTITIESTIEGRRGDFAIHADATVKLMSILTNLYSDPAEAVIREYSINAYDSHRKANQSRPVEVTLPTSTDPTFIVRDQGVGLSVDELFGTYAQYGLSTKEDSDQETGMLGLGCKSAFTFCQQFGLTAVKNGVRAVATFTLNAQGSAELTVDDTEATNEPDGVTVYIPVKDLHRFNAKAKNFFKFWEPGTVLVNGESPEPPVGEWLDPDVLLMAPQSTALRPAADIIVMGNIPYPVDQRHRIATVGTHFAMVRVPMGSVSFTPSREALYYQGRTLETLDTARTFITKSITRTAQKELDAAEDVTQALAVVRKWSPILRSHLRTLTYHGRKAMTEVHMPRKAFWYNHFTDRAEARGNSTYNLLVRETSAYGSKSNAVFITGHTTKSVNRAQRQRIALWLDEHYPKVPIGPDRPRPPHFYLVENMDWAHGWIPEQRCVPWSEFAAISVPSSGRTRTQQVYEVMDDTGTTSKVVKQLAIGARKVVYVSPAWVYRSRTTTARFRAALRSTLPGDKFLLVLVAKPQWGAFREQFPHALSLAEAINQRATDLQKRITRPITDVSNRTLRAWTKLDVAEILDPDVCKLIKANKVTIDPLAGDWRNILHLARLAHESFSVDVRFTLPDLQTPSQNNGSVDGLLKIVQQRYPLLEEWGWRGHSKEAATEYINALYLTRQGATNEA